LKIKICGITTLNDAVLCQELGADALGFVFYQKSKRYINPDKCQSITSQLSPFIIKVGVFVNENCDVVNQIVKIAGLNMVQLHGEETPEYVKTISVPVIKGFRVNNEFDFNVLNKYDNCYFLLDTLSTNEYGGTGKSFNWKIIPNNMKNKIILSGGINIDNIQDVINNINPVAVDLSSSVESEPGIKDANKLKQLFDKYKCL